jgi:hypothetical protein
MEVSFQQSWPFERERNSTHQHPVLDRGGSRARGGTVTFVVPSIKLRLELAEDERSSLGAMTGKRNVGFFEGSPRLVSCITRVVAVIRRVGGRCHAQEAFTQVALALGSGQRILQQVSCACSCSYEQRLRLSCMTGELIGWINEYHGSKRSRLGKTHLR